MKKNFYSVHPSVKKVQDWVENLPEKTGKSLEEWVDLLKKKGPKDAKEGRVWLREQYELATHAANWIVDYASGKSPWDGDPESYLKAAEQYVVDMYSGTKIDLRPLHDQLIKVALSLAPDVKVCPCQTIVPLYRNHVFAQIKPSTRTRIDLGFALQETPFSKRLVDTGGQAKKDRITHSIAITKMADIDDEVTHWLKKAYQLDT